MKAPSDFRRIFLFKGPVDMRKQIVGISTLVEQSMGENPFDEDCLYVFNNRRRDIIKAIYFDTAGFCLWCKRLDQGKFPWLSLKENADKVVISPEDLKLVFEGVDVFKRHPRLELSSLD